MTYGERVRLERRFFSLPSSPAAFSVYSTTVNMADALCGPSNPLQQFKQQTSLDRTLQQDRLTSRPSPAQGFRSRDPNAGLLDPEFEAFQAGLPAPNLPQYQPIHPQQQQGFAGPSQQQAPSWAADFERMQIASPQAPFQQQQHHGVPQTANWAQGFQQHIAQNAPRAQQTSSPSPLAFQQRARYGGYNGFQSNFAQQQPSFAPNVRQGKGKEPAMQFDDAAFDAAFDQAKVDMMADNSVAWDEAEEITVEEHEAREAAVDRLSEMIGVEELRKQTMADQLSGPADMVTEEQMRIDENMRDMVGEAPIEEQTQEQKQREEDDALAATAQELLEKVEHNKSDKFRNSQFLSLMRKLRDREVKVEGDKMVETVSTATTITNTTITSSALAPLLKPTLSPHDSSYGSGTSTPRSTILLNDNYHFDTHICEVPGCDADHTYDHWESPVH